MTEIINLASPVQEQAAAQARQTQQEAPQRVLQDASTDCITSEAKVLLDAVQATTDRDTLPAIQTYNPDASTAGHYLQAHYGRILRQMDETLSNVQIINSKDVDLLLRGFLVKLVNLSIRSKANSLNQQRIAKDTAQAENYGSELTQSLTAFMLTRKMQEQFSPDEIQHIREHALAGRYNLAKNLAGGQDVKFLTMDTDWKARADELAKVPSASSITASVQDTSGSTAPGDSVAVQFRNGGWVLSWWSNDGWQPIQCSEGLTDILKAEQKQQKAMDELVSRQRPVKVSQVFRNELA